VGAEPGSVVGREPLLGPGFVPPAYPYDRLDAAKALASAHQGGVVDLSIGTPCDPPPPSVVAALGGSGAERGYPTSVGSPAFREAASAWMERRLGVSVAPAAIAACVGTKEMVATLPQWLALRDRSRDTVLYPAVSYPTYEMGATLAGLRAVAVPVDSDFRLDLSAIDEADAARALLLWVNTPGNPAGHLDDLAQVAAWGRRHKVPVFSDECYVEFTWRGEPRTILEHGLEGLVAVHSLSKRSNLAGVRSGFYAGDPDLVEYLSEVRKHAGLMVAGPVQAASVVALADQAHVEEQRGIYAERLELFASILGKLGLTAAVPEGAFYLWVPAPDPGPAGRAGATGGTEQVGGPAWELTERLARDGGVIVSPGEFYGVAGAGYVRVALVAPTERLELVGRRLGVA
jgi:succinyldiaminopimelate transaminase